ncbi:MAG: hypothetical protein U1D55_18150 [Phycisphaerae bacterium]
MRQAHRSLAVAAVALCTAAPLRSDDEAVRAGIRMFFATSNVTRRASIARDIQRDAAFDAGKMSQYLHDAGLIQPLEPGTTQLDVLLPNGVLRRVNLRVPKRYDHNKPWPLLYALHGTGGNGPGIIRFVEHVLGDKIDDFVIAAPNDYEEAALAAAAAPVGEHVLTLRAVRKLVHIDADRVFAMGYSRGGHTSWTLAITHPDEFAGVIPLAGALLLPQVDKLYDPFVENAASTSVLAAWGADDSAGDDGGASPNGGIAGLNRKLTQFLSSRTLPIKMVELPGTGHAGVLPPTAPLAELLDARRERYPKRVKHAFRALSQARAYWLEGQSWTGSAWDPAKPMTIEPRGKETPEDALCREIRTRLGGLEGVAQGNTLDVTRKKLDSLTVWIGDELGIDWRQPVVLKMNGRKDWEARLDRSVYVCLSQAAETFDFERLRWAGLQFRTGRPTTPIAPP